MPWSQSKGFGLDLYLKTSSPNANHPIMRVFLTFRCAQESPVLVTGQILGKVGQEWGPGI